MSRKNLTSRKRSFGQNPSTFLDKVTEQPIDLTITVDGVPFTVKVNPNTAGILNSDELPANVTAESQRTLSENEQIP